MLVGCEMQLGLQPRVLKKENKELAYRPMRVGVRGLEEVGDLLKSQARPMIL